MGRSSFSMTSMTHFRVWKAHTPLQDSTEYGSKNCTILHHACVLTEFSVKHDELLFYKITKPWTIMDTTYFDKNINVVSYQSKSISITVSSACLTIPMWLWRLIQFADGTDENRCPGSTDGQKVNEFHSLFTLHIRLNPYKSHSCPEISYWPSVSVGSSSFRHRLDEDSKLF